MEDWLAIVAVVSLTVGVMSILVGVASIIFGARTYNATKDVLAEIDKRVGVIEEIVRGVQTKLVDTVTEIAKPQRATMEEQIMQMMLPAMLNNPDGMQQMKQLMELGQQMGKDKPSPEEE